MSTSYITACHNCADKLRKLYYLIEVENSQRVAQCRLCLRILNVEQFEFHPRRERRSRPRSGGGERARSAR